MKFKSVVNAISLSILIILIGCQSGNKPAIRIAVSKEKSAKSIQNYSGWLERYNDNIEWFYMYPLGIDSALKLMETCDGVLITGGEDVFPGIYGKIEDTARCGSIDRYRDSLEFALIDAAIEYKMPLLGICRGLQIINVALDGSLIIDIPSDYDTAVTHRQDDWQNCFHAVVPVEATHFNVITDGRQGEVASNHHQGIDVLGEGLQISAYATDSLPEAIEWDIRGEKAFMMAVQWHPERMDTLHHLSAPIAKVFLEEANKFRDTKPIDLRTKFTK